MFWFRFRCFCWIRFNFISLNTKWYSTNSTILKIIKSYLVFSRKSKQKFTCSKKAMCLDETTACCTTRFVNGENTFGHIQPFVVIWSDISWSLFIQWKIYFLLKKWKVLLRFKILFSYRWLLNEYMCRIFHWKKKIYLE